MTSWYVGRFIAPFVCAAFFHKAGEIEESRWAPLLWPLLSVGLWAAVAFGLGWQYLGCFATQIALFVGLTLWKMWLKREAIAKQMARIDEPAKTRALRESREEHHAVPQQHP